MTTTTFVAPDTRGWPDHWQRPTEPDLATLADGYRCGAVPPHHRVLNQPAQRVTLGSPQCQQVADRLYEVARLKQKAGQGKLAGLAAPQIGIALRAFLFDARDVFEDTPSPDDLTCVINPTVQVVEDLSVRLPEGCVSTGLVVGWVNRADRVLLDGHDPSGHRVQREFAGHAARVLQHEVDHLDGLRFPDRTVDDDLLWVGVEDRPKFTEHVKAVLRGEQVVSAIT